MTNIFAACLSLFINTTDGLYEFSQRVIQPVNRNEVLSKVQVDEKRGFVNVPLDYKNPALTIPIFYRMWPSTGPLKHKAPLIVVINGGPGFPSTVYRPYEFTVGGEGDSFAELQKHFRVLTFDQRGTGYSAPLDMPKVGNQHKLVAALFGANYIAKDLYRILKHLNETNAAIIGQSYGGKVLAHYLTDLDVKTKPIAAIFGSSSMYDYDPLDQMIIRRKSQLRLNLDLKSSYAEIEGLAAAVKKKLQESGMHEDNYHRLYIFIGKGESGVWEKNLVDEMKKIIALEPSKLKAHIDSLPRQGSLDPLNYILSSTEMTPGSTDRLVFTKLVRDYPFKDWMIDEYAGSNLPLDPSWESTLFDTVDRDIPTPNETYQLSRLRRAFHRTRVLFTFANNDSAIAPETIDSAVAVYGGISSSAKFRMLNGGHRAIFSQEGVAAIRNLLGY